jgi:hypothetical protein
MYDVLKDFASPAITGFAAIAALVVTVYFNKWQAAIASAQRDIAAAQRDIALDKLKYDLFEKRYEIYAASKKLLAHAIRWRVTLDKIDPSEIRDLRVKIDEARFFFGPEIRAVLKQIDEDCEKIFFKSGQRENMDPSDGERWREISDELSSLSADLHTIYGTLPTIFEIDMRFSNLTKINRDSLVF